jgi:hypothetical protein
MRAWHLIVPVFLAIQFVLMLVAMVGAMVLADPTTSIPGSTGKV